MAGMTSPKNPGTLGRGRFGVRPIGFLLLASGALALAGCATKGDLEALKQEIQASTAKVETLKGETKTGFESAKKQIAQELKAQQEALAKLTEAVEESQAKIAEISAKYKALSKDTDEVRSAVRSSNQTLHEFLKTEEAQLKEALRSVQSMLKEIGGPDKPEVKPETEKSK
ncbi:MAG: hypothetical protein HY581_03525 [Nitrospirae bacterium]|nr:hypothetical protein [Nitrospirota bacterium]